MNVELIIEGIIVVLLLATCSYCFLLNRRLQTLRSGQKELAALISSFDKASRRAEKNLSFIQSNGASVNRELTDAAARAHDLVDELSVMVNAGDNIACRIEGAVNEVRMIGRNKIGVEQRPVS